MAWEACSRSAVSDPITDDERDAIESRLKWLVSVTHLAVSRIHIGKLAENEKVDLTPREIEVLKWTADGKSAQEISEILGISKHAVDFHIKNVVSKLKTSNKTAAVVRAATLGLLNH